jgi:hypothetical protein
MRCCVQTGRCGPWFDLVLAPEHHRGHGVYDASTCRLAASLSEAENRDRVSDWRRSWSAAGGAPFGGPVQRSPQHLRGRGCAALRVFQNAAARNNRVEI